MRRLRPHGGDKNRGGGCKFAVGSGGGVRGENGVAGQKSVMHQQIFAENSPTKLSWLGSPGWAPPAGLLWVCWQAEGVGSSFLRGLQSCSSREKLLFFFQDCLPEFLTEVLTSYLLLGELPSIPSRLLSCTFRVK